MWAWLTALMSAKTDETYGYPAKAERRAKVTQAEMKTLFAKELSRKSIRR